MADVAIRRIGAGEIHTVMAAADLFDHPPISASTDDFLARPGHHLLVAYVGDTPAGFVIGIEIAHLDKGMEMMLYELGVAEEHRRRGIGTALTLAMLRLANDRGAHGMWVPTEKDNEAALATYLRTGATGPEDAAMLSWEITED